MIEQYSPSAPSPEKEASIDSELVIGHRIPRGGQVSIDLSEQLPVSNDTRIALARGLGLDLPVIAGLRLSSKSTDSFLIFDSREARNITTPFLLVQDIPGGNLLKHSKGIGADSPLKIGKSYHADRFDYSDRVSRNHFEINYSDDELTVSDLNSTNGTTITGHLMEDQPGYFELSPRNWRVRAQYTDLLEDGMRDDERYQTGDIDNPHGFYQGHPVIGRRSSAINGGVYGTSSSEHILVDGDNRITKRAIEKVLEGFDVIRSQPLDLLKSVESSVSKMLRYDLNAVEAISQPLYRNNEIINLSEFVDRGIGVCRHQALLSGAAIELAVKERLLPYGLVRVERNSTDTGGHAWAVYSDINNEGAMLDDVVVDPAQHYVGRRKDALVRDARHWPYIVDTIY